MDKTKVYKIPVNNYSVYKAILTIINFSLKLSNVEIDILATLFKYGYHTITVEARDILRKALDKDQYTINNYIKRLKDKKMLLETDNKEIVVNSDLKDVVESRKIVFSFDTNN